MRCVDIGYSPSEKTKIVTDSSLRFVRRQYRASGGNEFFISLEDSNQEILIGYARLRDIVTPHRPELQTEPCMMIRELKVLGREASLGQRTPEAYQHRGFGKKLLGEAERICFEEFGKKRLYVLSGVGVKQYYRKLGFSDDGMYLSKTLCT